MRFVSDETVITLTTPNYPNNPNIPNDLTLMTLITVMSLVYRDAGLYITGSCNEEGNMIDEKTYGDAKCSVLKEEFKEEF